MQWKMLSSLAAITSLFLLSGDLVAAQVLGPICIDITTSWQWSFNSLDQSPCEVTAYMMSTCYGGSFIMDPLGVGSTSYAGPSVEDAREEDACYCNTVIYNLVSACGGCQGGSPISLSEYYLNCTTTLEPALFPNPVPVGTQVPHWALLDPTSSNFWSASTAQLVGDTPEVTPGQVINSPAIPPIVSTSAVPEPRTTVPSSGSSGRGSNKSDITGGVVRGVTIVAAIAGLALSLCS
ncbi:hypothetical protein EI94DRAFT_1731877 [Lactarius quietus]|nr:hypothetical protein EI94DRAFT_1731877 [Lactarius quietus]